MALDEVAIDAWSVVNETCGAVAGGAGCLRNGQHWQQPQQRQQQLTSSCLSPRRSWMMTQAGN